LASEFDLIYQHQYGELALVMYDMLTDSNNQNNILNTAYRIMSVKVEEVTDDEYDDPNHDYDTHQYELSEYKYNKNELLKQGIDCDKLVYEDYLDDAHMGFITDNMKIIPSIFKREYINLIKNTENETVSRSINEKSYEDEDSVYTIINLINVGLDRVPAYLKKYSALHDMELSGNNFTNINKQDFPQDVGRLILKNCKNLTVLDAENLPNLKQLNLEGCSNVTKVGVTFFNQRNFDLSVVGTSITSTEQIILPQGEIKGVLRIKIPTSYKSFKCNNRSINIHYYVSGPMINVTTFYGMGLKTDFATYGSNVLMLRQELFPNIKEVLKVIDAYKAIYKKYPEFITDKTLEYFYNALQPTNLEMFEYYINKMKSQYNIKDADMFGLLVNLLSK
jgi:hypothetical protein